MDLPPNDFDDETFSFKISHEFTAILGDVYARYSDDKIKDAYFYMGFFKNEKTLFGWIAIPLFTQDS